MERGTVLLVDDELPLVEAVSFQLEKADYKVLVAHSGDEGLRLARRHGPDLILLDINLPGLDGLEVCQALRSESYNGPILLLSARDEEIDKVVGLEVGADDYVTKPFSARELVARVRAHLRRERRGTRPAGGLVLDSRARRVSLEGVPVELTPREFDLLEMFVNHPGQVLTRDQLLCRVWGYDYEGEERVVNVTVGRLREKLDSPDRIVTVRGVGYRYDG